MEEVPPARTSWLVRGIDREHKACHSNGYRRWDDGGRSDDSKITEVTQSARLHPHRQPWRDDTHTRVPRNVAAKRSDRAHLMAGKNDRFVKIVIWVVVAMMVLTFVAALLPTLT